MLVWLFAWSKVQTCIWPNWCHCHSLSLASVKSRLVLPFWYRLTWVVPEKGPLNGCVCVCVSRLLWSGSSVLVCQLTVGLNPTVDSLSHYSFCCMIMDNSVAFTALMLFWHQEEHPASKNWVVGMLICLERGADHLLLDWLMSLLSQIPIMSGLFKIQNCSTFLILPCPECPVKEAVRRGVLLRCYIYSLNIERRSYCSWLSLLPCMGWKIFMTFCPNA